ILASLPNIVFRCNTTPLWCNETDAEPLTNGACPMSPPNCPPLSGTSPEPSALPEIPPDAPPSNAPPVLWLKALRQAAQTKMPWLWHGYLAPGNITLLTSQWKSGKTTLVSVLLNRFKEGGELAGLPLAAGKAVVVSEEPAARWNLRSQKLAFG